MSGPLDPVEITSSDIDTFHHQGFLTCGPVIDEPTVLALRTRFDALFRGEYETGVPPDEVNWHDGDDPLLTRQVCNGWKADSTIASVVRRPDLARALASLVGWDGARLIQDNVLWKPPHGRSIGFHRDNAYCGWYAPAEMATCWIPLDDTSADGGTVEFAVGSNRWDPTTDPDTQFHAPDDPRGPVREAAERAGHALRIEPVELPAGWASFHHGWTWHGSSANRRTTHRRALVIHCGPAAATYHRPGLHTGMGPVYGRWLSDDSDDLPDEHFPVLWPPTQNPSSAPAP